MRVLVVIAVGLALIIACPGMAQSSGAPEYLVEPEHIKEGAEV